MIILSNETEKTTKKEVRMTKTVQFRSGVTLCKTGKDLTIQEPETEDNRDLLLAVFDSLNNLYEKLNKLNYVLQRNNIEHFLYPGSKGETK